MTPLAALRSAKQLVKGIKVENEHTKNTKAASEIAKDHLNERPDYYEKLDKMEKQKLKEELTSVSGITGLGYTSSSPAINTDELDPKGYRGTNMMAYNDENGNRLELLKVAHIKHHNKQLGFQAFDPKRIGAMKNFQELNETITKKTPVSSVIHDFVHSKNNT